MPRKRNTILQRQKEFSTASIFHKVNFVVINLANQGPRRHFEIGGGLKLFWGATTDTKFGIFEKK